MVVKMMKWRPWPPLQQSKKFQAKILVRSLTGFQPIQGDDHHHDHDDHGLMKLRVEIKWKGSKPTGLKSIKKKSDRKDQTKEQKVSENGVVRWDEEFQRVIGLTVSKDKEDETLFHPCGVTFLVFTNSKKQQKKRIPLAAPTILNLADFVSLEDMNEVEINVPLSILPGGFKCIPSLCITLNLTELRTTQELSDEEPRPILFAPLSPCFGGSFATKKDEGTGFKSSLRKVKSLTDYVSSRSIKRVQGVDGSSDGKFSTGSDVSDSIYPFDTDSFDDSDECEFEQTQDDSDIQKSCGYGTLMHANLAGGALDLRINCEDESLVYYNNHKSNINSSPTRDFAAEVSEKLLKQSTKVKILAWRKRKLSFRSPKVKGEPLLKKDYGDDGGDDIDFDRRQLSSDESMGMFKRSTGSAMLISEFGDDNFAVGSWEQKEVVSRDGSWKLHTQIFFASIDQRSERAAGESACTALVTVIADWLQSNQGIMPLKSEFDSLIREGSLQWRNLCENDTYRERFSDKHFDLDTVLEAKIRSLAVVPEKSFIGFFHPEGLEEECIGFLDGAMSFDNIWDEICLMASKQDLNSEPLVYIVSWNDHFFLLKVENDAYYIIDTLGERLYEGCNQAYVLKFDKDTIIESVPSQNPGKSEEQTNGKSKVKETPTLKEKSTNTKAQSEKLGTNSPDRGSEIVSAEDSEDGREEKWVVCKGKESCKEYIKSFLAAIPIRELQVDLKKGSSSSNLLHQRLQVEFNFTIQLSPQPVEDATPVTLELVMADELEPIAANELALIVANELAPMADDEVTLTVTDELEPTAVDKVAPMVVDLTIPMVPMAVA